MHKLRHSPWVWIPCLFAAEELPSAIVTFVSLIMFFRFGESMAMSAFYSSLLTLPWILKSYMRSKVIRAGRFKRRIHLVEFLLLLSLTAIAYYLNTFRVNVFLLFLLLMSVAVLCAWHELLARIYYNRMLFPRQQRLFNPTRVFAIQTTLVLTYGVLIIIAGFFEIFFRNVRKAWAMESYLVVGVFMIFFFVNMLTMQNPRLHNPSRYQSLAESFRGELRVLDRLRHKPNILRVVVSFCLLLFPASILFNTRVFFLMTSAERGGLGCSVQDVGYAQGAIGVTAFSVGIIIGRSLYRRFGCSRMFWPYAVALTLSPLCYVFMSLNPLYDNLQAICSMTLITQLAFGFGLNICQPFVRYISNDRYSSTINYLYIPFVALAMIVPMAISGWLAQQLGFFRLFLYSECVAPLAWLVVALLGTRKILTENNS